MVSVPFDVKGTKLPLESVSQVRSKLPAVILMFASPETVLPIPLAVSDSIFPASLSAPLMVIVSPLMKEVLLEGEMPAAPMVIVPAVALPIVTSEKSE